ncbi:MAG: MBL fold metallo-hydrolase [Nitrososphaerales archaeon]
MIPEKDYGARVEKTKGTTSLASGSVLVTGEIPRVTTFEKGLAPNTQYLKLDGEFRHEPLILDDQALVVSVKDKGLVVITGCGHAGIVNTTDYARQISGVDRVHALIGGLHLEGQYFDPIIDQTVDSLEKISPKFIVPAHCTGLRASFKIFGAMPQNYVESGVGTTFKF